MLETINNHDLRCVNGKTLYMPPWYGGGEEFGNLAIPDVYTLDTSQKYPLSTAFRDGLRTFVYTYVNQGGYEVANPYGGYFIKTTATTKALTDALVTGAKGASTIELNYGGSACAKDKYAGGMMGIKGLTTDGVRGSRYIISNTLKDGSNYVVFTIDGTLPVALTGTDDFVLLENPYTAVKTYSGDEPGGSEFVDGVMYVGGIVVSKVVDARYMWVQTWGPFFCIGIVNSFEGDAPPQQGIYVQHGAINRHPTNTSSVATGGHVDGAVQQVGWSLGQQRAVSTIGETCFLIIHP